MRSKVITAMVLGVALLLSAAPHAYAHEWGTTARIYPDTLVGVVGIDRGVTTDAFTLRTKWTVDSLGVKSRCEDFFYLDGQDKYEIGLDKLEGKEVVIRGMVRETISRNNRNLLIKIESMVLKDPRVAREIAEQERKKLTETRVDPIEYKTGHIQAVEGYVFINLKGGRLLVYRQPLDLVEFQLAECDLDQNTEFAGIVASNAGIRQFVATPSSGGYKWKNDQRYRVYIRRTGKTGPARIVRITPLP